MRGVRERHRWGKGRKRERGAREGRGVWERWRERRGLERERDGKRKRERGGGYIYIIYRYI